MQIGRVHCLTFRSHRCGSGDGEYCCSRILWPGSCRGSLQDLESVAWKRGSHLLDCRALEIPSERFRPTPLDLIHSLFPLKGKGWGQRGKQNNIIKSFGTASPKQIYTKLFEGKHVLEV